MFNSEADLLKAIEIHDALVHRCVVGELGFWKFCDEYNDFFYSYALGGHESDESEIRLLEKHQDKISPHRVISFEILAFVCSDEDAKHENYKSMGRFGSDEALQRLRNVKFPA